MKKGAIIITLVVVIVAATVLGLFATGVLGKKKDVANAATATVKESGYFGNLGKDAYFDICEDRDPSLALDNYVRVEDSRGNRVALKSTRLDNGYYRVAARDGFVERATYRIRLYLGAFVAEQYAPYDTFIFTIAGKGEVEQIILKDGVEAIAIEETEIQPIQVGTEYFFDLYFAKPAEERYQEGQILLAKKPARCFLGDEFDSIYTDTKNRNPYSNFAAYYVLRESKIMDGREEVYCRLAKMNEVFETIDIYKSVPITKDNLNIDEEALAEQIANSSFGQAVLEAAEKTVDLYKAEFPIRTEKPKMVVSVFADAIFPDPDTSGLQNALPAIPTMDQLKSAIPAAEMIENFLSALSGNSSVSDFMSNLPNMSVEDFFSNLPDSVNLESVVSDLAKNLSVDSFISNLPNINVSDYISNLPMASVQELISGFSNMSVTDFMSNLPDMNVSEYFSNLPIESLQGFISNFSNFSITDFMASLPDLNISDYVSNLPTESIQSLISGFSNMSLSDFMTNLPEMNVSEYFSKLPTESLQGFISNFSNFSISDFMTNLPDLKISDYISNLPTDSIESLISGFSNMSLTDFMSNLPEMNVSEYFSKLPTESLEGFISNFSNMNVTDFMSYLPSVNVGDYFSNIPTASIEGMVSDLLKGVNVESFFSNVTESLTAESLMSSLPNVNVQEFFTNLPENVSLTDFFPDLPSNTNVQEYIASLPTTNLSEYFQGFSQSKMDAIVSNLTKNVSVDGFLSSLSSNLTSANFMSSLPTVSAQDFFSNLPKTSVQDYLTSMSINSSVDSFIASLPTDTNASDYFSGLPQVNADQMVTSLSKNLGVQSYISSLSQNISLQNLTSNLPNVSVQEFFANLPKSVNAADFLPELPKGTDVQTYIASLPNVSASQYFSGLSSTNLNGIVSVFSKSVNVENYISSLTNGVSAQDFIANLPSMNVEDFISKLPTGSVTDFISGLSSNLSVDNFKALLPANLNVEEYLSKLPNVNVESFISGLSSNLDVNSFKALLPANLNVEDYLKNLPDLNVQSLITNLSQNLSVDNLMAILPKDLSVESFMQNLPNVNVQSLITNLSQNLSVDSFKALLPENLNVEDYFKNLPDLNVESLISNLSENLSVDNLKALLPTDLSVESFMEKLPEVNMEGLISGLSQYLNVDSFKALLPTDLNIEDYFKNLPDLNVESLITNLSENLTVEKFMELLPDDMKVSEYFKNLSDLNVKDFMSKLPTLEDLKPDLSVLDEFKSGQRNGEMTYAAELILNITFTITIAKGVDIVFGLNNRVKLDPYLNFEYSYDLSSFSFNYELNFGANISTETVASISMDIPQGKMEATSVDDFKEKFTALLSDKTMEKAICANEVKIWNIEYWIYCFTLNLEIGFDFDFEIKAQIDFEYHYNTQMSMGVTVIDGDFTSYKSFDSNQSATDLVLFGKATIKAGLYLKFMGTLLSVAGVGFKIKFGAYGEIGGQIRLDMQAAIEKKKLHIMKGYYITAGLYIGMDFSVKAGIDVPYLGFLGYKNNWELLELKYPFFEYGSKYLIKEFVNPEMTVEIQGASAQFDTVQVNAFDLDKIADANQITVPLDSFNFEYIGDAEKFITLRDGGVYVSPAVGKEFNAQVKLIAKSDDYVTGIVTFHKAAVVPTCDVRDAKFDKKTAADVTFNVALNKSEFVSFTGRDITPAYYSVKSSGAITISKNFLKTLPMGEHKFNYNTNRGNIVLTVVVMDSTPITVEKSTATFNKSANAPVSFKMNLHGNAIKNVEGLKKGEYTVDKSDTFVIYAIALISKEAGAYDFTVQASNDTEVTLTVTVKDDRAPVLFENSFTFAKTASLRKAVPVRFEKYGYTVKGIEGNGITAGDYSVEAGCASISAGYLAKLAAGPYNFTIRFKQDSKEIAQSFTVTVRENAAIIAYTAYAEFDLNAPTDAKFTVVATGSILVSGNNIAAANYSYSGTTLTIKSGYLSGLPLGEYTFNATSGNESTALTVKVINTAVPEILSEDVQADGTLVLKYDRGAPNGLSFELFLTDKEAFSAEGLQYSLVKTEKGTYKLTVANEFLAALTNGNHEFELLTGTNSLFLTIKVFSSAKPIETTQSSLSYMLGSGSTISVSYSNAKKMIKNIEVRGEGVTADTKAISVEQYSYTVDCETLAATFSIESDFCEMLPVGYYRVILTFSDEDGENECTANISIAVGNLPQE